MPLCMLVAPDALVFLVAILLGPSRFPAMSHESIRSTMLSKLSKNCEYSSLRGGDEFSSPVMSVGKFEMVVVRSQEASRSRV